jgi:hypothetical protein
MLNLALGLALLSPPAAAGPCDGIVKKAATAKGEALAAAYGELARCDKAVAEAEYKTFMKGATDTDALHALSLAAIRAEVWNPVWKQLEYLDYATRDEVAERLGEACATEPKVVTFLSSSYLALRDIEFQRWGRAFNACTAAELDAWVLSQVESPPDQLFDEKYNSVVTMFVKKQRAAALPALARGAIKAAANGPYDALLMQMDEAVSGELGGERSAADAQALEAALVEVASNVDPQKAKAVADRLAAAGSGAAAARLLPRIFPDRVQPGGGFLYGAASVEEGDCGGEKSVVIHLAEVTDPGRRWLILPEVEKPLRAVKPKLAKCTAAAGDWPVATSPEPLKSAKDVEAWAATLEKAWSDKGYTVKVQAEKVIALK